MTKIGCLFDKKDDIDLMVIKPLAILLTITILAYFVFHVKVRTDTSSDATLFNLFSTIIAFTSEARSGLLVFLISNELYSWMDQTTLNIIRVSAYLFSLIYVFNIVGVTCCSLIKHLSPTLYLRMSQSWISAKIILAVEIIASALTNLIVINECKVNLFCIRNFMFDSMRNVALASSGILMIMHALQYGRGLTKLGKFFRNKHQPRRESESATANIVSQVCVFKLLKLSINIRRIQTVVVEVVDQSNLILTRGILFSVVLGSLTRLFEVVLEFSPIITYTLVLFNHTCIPILWIYLSEKLQVVMWKCIRRSKSNICCCF